MPLTAGSRIGPYEILAPLGTGGMGEVYRARDSRLNRDVALKALPDQFSVDGERVERFKREAQLLAALNHPHIAAIYGLEEAHGAQFILLELVEGGTLAERLARAGAIPIREALRIARDVADAIEAAHDKGIVHRDLKPGNIALTRDSRPKVLDFGLAKAFAPDAADAATRAAATRSGVVVGTVPYMSPEQTRGQTADKRSDIWAFGCLLYEMLSGRSPFGGRSTSDVIVSILERDPDFGALPAATPPRVRWLLRRCLQKDPDRRLHDIANARIELDEALSGTDSGSDFSAPSPLASARPLTRERLAWLVALIAVALLVAALALPRRADVTPATTDLYRASIVLPDDLRLAALEPAARFAVSPDGRRLAVVASNVTGVPMLWVRSFDSLVAQPLPGTEWASYPFWSPDSRSIAFVTGHFDGTLIANAKGRLRRVDLAGGQPLTLAENALGATGAWSRDDVILFTPSGSSPLHKVSARGGASVPASTLDSASGEVQHSYPVFLPDGQHYLYKVLGSRGSATESRGLYVGSLAGGDPPRRLLERGSNALYANGHLLFVRESTLFAQRFDSDAIALRGDPIALAERVQASGTGTEITGAFGVSDTGTLVYQPGLLMRSRLAWLDRSGRTIAPVGGPADYAEVALAPDGSRAAVSEMDARLGTRDVVIVDVQRGVRERFTSEPSDDFAPVWSPTGDRIAFTSAREGRVEIYARSSDGSGRERQLAAGGSTLGKFAASWSPDGSKVLFVAGGRVLARSDIHVTEVDDGGATTPVLENGSVETHPRFSPDGRWVAYSDNDSGEMQVYVRRFRGAGEKLRVSVSGGAWPRWRGDGRELFFLSPGGELMSVAVASEGDALKLANPQPLFKVRLRPMGRLDAYPYDVTKDGQRFLCNLFVDEATSSGLTLVVNWPAALR